MFFDSLLHTPFMRQRKYGQPLNTVEKTLEEITQGLVFRILDNRQVKGIVNGNKFFD